MATQTEPAPAPGPEIQLGAPKTGLTTLSEETLARLNQFTNVAGESDEPAKAPEPPKAAPTPEKPISAAKQPTATPDAPKPEAKTTPPPASPADEPDKVKASTPKQLREAYERASAKAAELESSLTATSKEKADAFARLAEIEAKYKIAEERIQKEFEPARVRLTEIEKRLQEKEEALRIRDYTATTEWHEKYEKPLTEVNSEAQLLLSELRANIDGQEVPATMEHFNHILAAPSLNEAARRATALFGEFAAPQIVNLRTRIGALQRKRSEAAKNAQLESAEWQKRVQADQIAQREHFRKLLTERQKAYMSEFQVAEGDNEMAQALSEGLKLADLATEGSPDFTPDQFVDTIAKARTHIAKSFAQEKSIQRLKGELKAAQDRLALYEASEPPVETRNNGSRPAPEANDTWAQLTEKAAKIARSV